MPKNLFTLVAIIGSFLLLSVPLGVAASENIELIKPDVKTDLQAFRNDGKFTLAMIRYNGCEPCNESELEMQQW